MSALEHPPNAGFRTPSSFLGLKWLDQLGMPPVGRCVLSVSYHYIFIVVLAIIERLRLSLSVLPEPCCGLVCALLSTESSILLQLRPRSIAVFR